MMDRRNNFATMDYVTIMRADGSKQRLVNHRLLPYRWYHAVADRARLWWRTRAWRRRQREFAHTKTHYYGDGGTIHGSTHVDVELHEGRVVAVWFRCRMLPFEQRVVDDARAMDMQSVSGLGQLRGVEIKDHDR